MTNITTFLLPMQPSDIVTCARIFADVYSNPPWDYHWVTVDKAEKYMCDIVEAVGFRGFLYYENETLTGFCVGAATDYFFGPQYEIKECAVVPSRQRRGAGSRMLAIIEKKLAEDGVMNIYLHTSRTIPAHEFYIKNGYTPVSDNIYFMKEI